MSKNIMLILDLAIVLAQENIFFLQQKDYTLQNLCPEKVHYRDKR